MNTRTTLLHTSSPPRRCLRHHVWMAACDACREAHRVPAPRRVPGTGELPTR